MPVTLFATENWTGAALAPIEGHPMDPGPGLWRGASGGFVYDVGRARIATSFPTVNLAYDEAFLDRDVQRIEMNVISDNVMLVARFNRTTKQDYYLAHFQGTFVHLYVVVNNVAEWLDTVPVAVTGTDIFALDCNGSTIRILWNSVPVMSGVDGTWATGTVGIKCYTPNRFFGPIRIFVGDPVPTTPLPITGMPTTSAPTTPAPTTLHPTTPAPSTPPEPTFPPTTPAPTTSVPTTLVVTTPVPTTPAPTTPAPSTTAPLTPGPITDGTAVNMSLSYVENEDLIIVRAWAEDANGKPRTQPFTELSSSTLTIWGEFEKHLQVSARTDPLGSNLVRFAIPQARLFAQHLYLLEIQLLADDGGPGVVIGPRLFSMPVN